MKSTFSIKAYALFFIFLFLSIKSEAKLKIPFGSRDVVDVIYTTSKQDSLYEGEDKLDIARSRWGAKLLLIILIGIPIAGSFCGKDDDIKEPTKL